MGWHCGVQARGIHRKDVQDEKFALNFVGRNMETTLNDDARERITHVIQRIRVLKPRLDSVVEALQVRAQSFPECELEEHSAEYWRSQAVLDAALRVRIFVERNFLFLESLAVMALRRYTLELAVWLKLLSKDDRFSYVYARLLVRENEEQKRQLARHIENEIELYELLAAEEKDGRERAIKAVTSAEKQEPEQAARHVAQAIAEVSREVDEKLALHFALYSDSAIRNGYSFQAYLLRTRVLPEARNAALDNKGLLDRCNEKWGAIIDGLELGKEWSWKTRAGDVDMSREYEFIYSFTSRLLHAKPSSLTTDQKSLEDDEMLMLLRYVALQFEWLLSHAEAHASRGALH